MEEHLRKSWLWSIFLSAIEQVKLWEKLTLLGTVLTRGSSKLTHPRRKAMDSTLVRSKFSRSCRKFSKFSVFSRSNPE